MQLSNITNVPMDAREAIEIPWNDPGFSERLLEMHLSQEHDWASRRFDIIERQVAWITRQLPKRQSRILDLCCGPGFYTHRLAALGHQCTGIDFSPASIDYAKKQAADDSLDIEYILTDLRGYEISGTYDLIMMTFGEFNIFRKRDSQNILLGACSALHDGGILIVETYTYEEVRRIGRYPEQRQSVPYGIFSDRPYYCKQSQFWDDSSATASTKYLVVDKQSSKVSQYSTAMQAYTDAQLSHLLDTLGILDIQKIHESDWPVGHYFSGKLQVFRGRRAILDVN